MKFRQDKAAELKPVAVDKAFTHPPESLPLLAWQIDGAGQGLSFNAAFRDFCGEDYCALLGTG